jgi:4-diphosphocytidyl-2-C-methyl-D-erythritol kinase
MESGSSSFGTLAHAKVNLALAIGRRQGPREMHPICSWMHAIELADEIEIDGLDEGQKSVYELGWATSTNALRPVAWAIEDDLTVRAHRLIEAGVGRSLPIRLRVSKQIPAGGGLGGGSSDAASVLVGLNQLFDLGLTHEQLCAFGLELGSDVPFFLDPCLDTEHPIPRPAIVEGLGETITRLARTHAGSAITLFCPSFGCDTGQVYSRFDEMVDADHVIDADRVRRCAGSEQIDNCALFNDLATPAAKVEPELGVLWRTLEAEINQPIHVSGSGSTLFVVGSYEPSSGRAGEQGSPIGCTIHKSRLC